MPYYNDRQYFTRSDSTLFTTLQDVSTAAPVSGIYRCTLCGHEIVVDKGRHLPPDGNHGCKSENALAVLLSGRKEAAKKFQWQLVAAPIHRHSSPNSII
ncbi:hypothetical protein [Acetobacter senegalensis]|uniref:hypothetical protein n=1 Tax=Acetobacter senegalensis TaxID=446692 RepID=UPI000B3326FE|nr:hypothetical protein [Acetobacter senegalensis]